MMMMMLGTMALVDIIEVSKPLVLISPFYQVMREIIESHMKFLEETQSPVKEDEEESRKNERFVAFTFSLFLYVLCVYGSCISNCQFLSAFVCLRKKMRKAFFHSVSLMERGRRGGGGGW